MTEIFIPFQRLQHLPSHMLFYNVTLPPLHQKVESTWSTWLLEGIWLHGPVDYGRSEVSSASNWPGRFCLLPLGTFSRYSLSELKRHAVWHLPYEETTCRHSSWQPASIANCMREPFGYPVHSSLQMPAASATTTAWASPSKSHLGESIQPTETWDIINYCVKPLNFEKVCYAAVDNLIPLFQLVLCVNQDKTWQLSDCISMKEQLEISCSSLHLCFPIYETQK